MNKLIITVLCLIFSCIYASQCEYKNGKFSYSLDASSDVSQNEMNVFKQFMESINDRINNELDSLVKLSCKDHTYQQYTYDNMRGSFSLAKGDSNAELTVDTNNDNNHHKFELSLVADGYGGDINVNINQNYYFDLCELANLVGHNRQRSTGKSEWKLYDDSDNMMKFEHTTYVTFQPKKGIKLLSLAESDVKISSSLSETVSVDKIIKFVVNNL